MKNERIVFVDQIDYAYHLDSDGGDRHGIQVWNTLEDLKRDRSCWSTCGVLKVKMTVIEEVEPENV